MTMIGMSAVTNSEDIEYTPPDLSEYYKNYSPRFSVFSPPIMGPAGSQTSVGLKITASSAEHHRRYKKGLYIFASREFGLGRHS
jgi:hypothetical protein